MLQFKTIDQLNLIKIEQALQGTLVEYMFQHNWRPGAGFIIVVRGFTKVT
jgi:hypothetical protein